MKDHALAWFGGHLSGPERVVSALAPLAVLLVYTLVAAALYVRRARQGRAFEDADAEQRRGGLTTPGIRRFFAWMLRPLWLPLARSRFPPDVITTLSMAIALAAGAGVAAGRFGLGGWLYLGAGLLDFLDGRVARATGRTSPAGAALDSILDRYVESAFLMGLCWYYRQSWALAAGLFALSGSLFVPYVRARGEALGLSLKERGFMQRAERVVVLGAGTALSPVLEVLLAPGNPHPPHRLALGALVVLAVTSQITALERFIGLRRELNGETASPWKVARHIKSALANALATLVDGAVAAVLFYVASAHPGFATSLGCVAGAAVSFAVSRVWAFEVKGGALVAQMARYAFGSATTLGLNAGGVVLLCELGLPFAVAWVATRAVVFATWSYPIQRDFVFGAWLTAPGEPRGR